MYIYLFYIICESLVSLTLTCFVACAYAYTYRIERIGPLSFLLAAHVRLKMSDRVLEVHFLPELTTEKALENSIVVIIDILRASTTITYALAAGAKCIYPFLTINEVVSWKKENIVRIEQYLFIYFHYIITCLCNSCTTGYFYRRNHSWWRERR
mmetsp:Transcript_13627/g.15838  ORF Transcript_13627/g.15838 Transcript_13627/m.15838 type:complete len:154 (+) Transcript_13627:235-696(+)